MENKYIGSNFDNFVKEEYLLNRWTLHPNGLETVEKDQLFKALSKAQSEFPTIQPNRKAYKNEYADLYGLFRPVYPVLTKYGLTITPWEGIINGEECIGAILGHESGQYRTNYLKLVIDPCKNPNDQPSHKKQGSITYFERNHMKDMIGLLVTEDPDDDDGQSHLTPTVHHRTETITKDQEDELNRVLEGHPDICKQVLKGWGIDTLSQMAKDKYSVTMDRIISLKQLK